MKVVFLDIDGVLNFADSKSKIDGSIGIDTKRLRNLKKIIDATGAKIVLTSSWSLWYDVTAHKNQNNPVGKYLYNKLRRMGLFVYDTIDESIPLRLRGSAILKYLADHSVNQWVVIDDEMFDYIRHQPVYTHLIHTVYNTEDEWAGLTEDLSDTAIEILNGKTFNEPVIDKNFCAFWLKENYNHNDLLKF